MSADRIRVGVSGLPLGNRSGTGSYTEQLLRVLPERGGSRFSIETLTPGIPPTSHPRSTRSISKLGARWPFRFLADRALGKSLEGLDLLHLPNAVGPPVKRIPIVATLHDVSPFVCPETFPPLRVLYLKRMFSTSVNAARVTITDTHWQAERIREIWPGIGGRLRVVHPTLDPAFWESPPSPASCEVDRSRPYFLMVGALEPRKRVELAIEAWERAEVGVDFHLVGRWGWKTGGIRRAFERLGPMEAVSGGSTEVRLPDGRVLRHSAAVPLERLIDLYRNARALVYPSLFEGFGLPILEAMALGCPVVTRKESAMEETAGPAGWFFEGDSVEGLKETLEAIVAKTDLRHGRIALGVERAKGFDDARFYEGIAEAYESALG